MRRAIGRLLWWFVAPIAREEAAKQAKEATAAVEDNVRRGGNLSRVLRGGA